MDKKSDYKQVKVGDYWSRVSNGKITGINSDGFIIENEEGKSWQISREIIDNEFYFHNQYTVEIEVTRSVLAELFIKYARLIMTVNFNKQIKEKDLNTQYFELYANKGGKLLSQTEYEKSVKSITKTAIKGEERTIVGRHESHTNDFGRMHFTDVEANWDKSKDYDTRHRLVDPRTLNWMIVNNVKYITKK